MQENLTLQKFDTIARNYCSFAENVEGYFQEKRNAVIKKIKKLQQK